MSNKTQLQTNNTKLAALIETLNGKAAGGASVETCSVEMKHYPTYSTSFALTQVVYLAVDANGDIVVKKLSSSDGTISHTTNSFVLTDVVCPSILFAYAGGTRLAATNCEGIHASYGAHTIQINGDATAEFQPQG